MAGPDTHPPKVLISYSHDSPEHADCVRELSDRLRADGIDCILDQYEVSPPEGWPLWMDRATQRNAEAAKMEARADAIRAKNAQQDSAE